MSILFLMGSTKDPLPIPREIISRVPTLCFASDDGDNGGLPVEIPIPSVSRSTMELVVSYLSRTTHTPIPHDIDAAIDLAMAAAFLGLERLPQEICTSIASSHIEGKREGELLGVFGESLPITVEERDMARRACAAWLL